MYVNRQTRRFQPCLATARSTTTWRGRSAATLKFRFRPHNGSRLSCGRAHDTLAPTGRRWRVLSRTQRRPAKATARGRQLQPLVRRQQRTYASQVGSLFAARRKTTVAIAENQMTTRRATCSRRE